MPSSPPTTVHLSDLFWRDSGTTQDSQSHFCLAYHCPCGPHTPSPVSEDSRHNSEHSLVLEIQSEANPNRQPVGKATSPIDPWNAGALDIAPPQGMDDDEVIRNGHISREGSDRDQILMLQNPPLSCAAVDSNHQELWAATPQPQISPTTPVTYSAGEFDIEEFVKSFDVSPRSSPKLSDVEDSDRALEYSPTYEPEAHPIPLEATSPEPHLPKAYSAVPLLPHATTQSLSPTPTASQSQSSPLQTDNATSETRSKPAETTGSLAPLVTNTATYLGLGAQHVPAPFSQPQSLLSHPPVSSLAQSQQLVPVRSNLAQLWSTPRSADGQLGGPSISLPLPPLPVAHRAALIMPSRQRRATNRLHTPQTIHAPTPRRIIVPPLLTTSGIQMIPTALQAPVNTMRQQPVPTSCSYPPIPQEFSMQYPSANSVSQAPGVSDNNDSARHNMLQQARLYAAQVSSKSNGRTYKRSFEQLEMSNPISIMATNPKPPKRQNLQYALKLPIVQFEPHFTFPPSFSSQLISSSFTNHNQLPNFAEPHSEAGTSAQISDISNTLGARVSSSGRHRPRKKTKSLAAYKEFLGNIYICAWDRCDTTLSSEPYQDRTAFQNDVFSHLEGHLPREVESDGKWHCRWSMESSVSCAEELHDVRGIIRHIYGRHQESKQKCKNCPKTFSRAELFNGHKEKCKSARAVVEEEL